MLNAQAISRTLAAPNATTQGMDYNYIPQNNIDIITYPWSRYLRLKQNSSIINSNRIFLLNQNWSGMQFT